MRPRRIISKQEAAQIFEQAAHERALVVLSTQQAEDWHTFKSRFLECDPRQRFFVLDHQPTHGTMPPPLIPGQYVGVSLRHKSRKVMFSTVVESKGRFVVDGDGDVPAIRYRWPQTLTELQRRAYFRTPVPPGAAVAVSLWPGGIAARCESQGAGIEPVAGECMDLSCGGTLIRVRDSFPGLADDQTVGVELRLPDGRPPLQLDAQYRGVRPDGAGYACVAVQFVGLEISPEGRTALQRLARCVQQFHHLEVPSRRPDGHAPHGKQ
jgi:c-di-GMP-binding flagellar brake protein YcgR